MKKADPLPALCLLLGLLLAGCGKPETESPIRVALTDDIVSLDLAGTKDIMSETVGRCVFATLYTFDENMALAPCLAESEERLSPREWLFHLRRNATFQDGSPIRATDVVFSLNRAMSIDLAEKSLLIIDAVQALDDHTVKVTTNQDCADLKPMFVRVSTSVMSERAVRAPGYDFDRPVGSGPYRVADWKKGESILLERFDGYFAGPAQNRYLEFVIDPSEQNRTASLLNDTVDVTFRLSTADSDYLKLEEKVKVHERPSTRMELLSLNPDAGPLRDIRVRQAIFCAIDRQKLVDKVANGYGVLLNSMVPPPVTGAIAFTGFGYDPEKARRLLKESGHTGGFALTVISFDELRKQMLEYIKLDLAQVGIRMDYEFYELADYLKVIKGNRHMATLMSWTSNPDPDSTFSQLFSKSGHVTTNHSKFSDERVEALLAAGRRESDPDGRRAIYEEANRLVAERYCVLPLYQPSVVVAAGADIEGLRLNAQGLFGYESLCRVSRRADKAWVGEALPPHAPRQGHQAPAPSL